MRSLQFKPRRTGGETNINKSSLQVRPQCMSKIVFTRIWLCQFTSMRSSTPKCFKDCDNLSSWVSAICADANSIHVYSRSILLGVTYFVFKEAVHTRYEHCIGTAYMCLRMLEILETNSHKIDELLKKCVIVSSISRILESRWRSLSDCLLFRSLDFFTTWGMGRSLISGKRKFWKSELKY